MTAAERRQAIERALAAAPGPLSASELASRFGVSRQIVVGDVALLRAAGAGIVATPRGYVLAAPEGGTRFTVACRHSAADMARELEIMVDNGCTVEDVIVEHPLYGQLTGALQLRSRYDVRQFVRRAAQEEALPLSALTDGIHLHTLLCPDPAARDRVLQELAEAGFLLSQEP